MRLAVSILWGASVVTFKFRRLYVYSAHNLAFAPFSYVRWIMSPIVSRFDAFLGSALAKLLIMSAHVSRSSRYCILFVKLVMNFGGLEPSEDVGAGPRTFLSLFVDMFSDVLMCQRLNSMNSKIRLELFVEEVLGISIRIMFRNVSGEIRAFGSQGVSNFVAVGWAQRWYIGRS